MRYHRTTHLPNVKRMVCHLCGYKCHHHAALTDHINAVHLDKKLHKCRDCDFTAGHRPGLDMHRKSHMKTGKEGWDGYG